MNKQQYVVTSLIGIALYLIATGLSFAAFSVFGDKKTYPTVNTSATTADGQENFIIDPSVPRTEECPLNGKFYTKQEREICEKRRPLAVMIENHAESRPQSGLSHADVVYEAVAEGGITRFMSVFYCGLSVRNVNLAPVRSA